MIATLIQSLAAAHDFNRKSYYNGSRSISCVDGVCGVVPEATAAIWFGRQHRNSLLYYDHSLKIRRNVKASSASLA